MWSGTSDPKGICSAALHCRTPSPTGGSTYRPVGRGPRAPPKNAYPAAGHMGPALQEHTPPKKTTRRPLNKGAPRVFRLCVAQTEEGYIRRSMQAGTAGVNYSFTTVTLFAIWVSPLSPIVPVMVLLLRVRVIVPVPLFLYLIAALSSAR